ncbi:glucosyltransferase Alg6 [Schizosaccharomyces japonicus yFS275]|uniref:Alpha-1,3-glucosyltransferase n=1 Tax=Schizosaccharomyces japonicus (strain yFS275 / FY16936) TaxID=402676 RepID=B6K4U3_SCHJY|nr:glucosyltransferase Alg6 [Schizosaccharomyces japonicus yFS275]EEB08500.1 glucosyltransferase Alg6 [Schizosaccharomyces japonicus yFS275]
MNSLPDSPIPIKQFVSRFKQGSTKQMYIPCISVVVILIQWLVSIGSYSGKGAPPMFGDFEAQRHWMELTLHVPISQWYYENLEWWGLDYPPLTAFVSWLFGIIGNYLGDPAWFAFEASHGLETEGLKLYMRSTVIICHALVLTPPLIFYSKWWTRRIPDFVERNAVLTMVLLQPALMLIDHGHFQYNCVMLGLVMYSIANLLRDQYIAAAILFCLSVCFKQMSLYFAPAIFAYLLGRCMKPRFNPLRLLSLGLTVISTFALNFLPWLYLDYRLFEDKVANFWCAINVIIKIRKIFSLEQLKLISLIFTLAAILPSCVMLYMYPRKRLLAFGFASCAWGFFLFSFQVHEKTVLLPLMLTTVLLCHGLADVKSWVSLANNLAVFSLWPLLKRDGLILQFFVLVMMWNWLGRMIVFSKNLFFRYLQASFYVAMIVLLLTDIFVSPPARFPDIWVVLNVLVSFAGFVVIWLWLILRMLHVTSKLSHDLNIKKQN